jgi:hypothetical protein
VPGSIAIAKLIFSAFSPWEHFPKAELRITAW